MTHYAVGVVIPRKDFKERKEELKQEIVKLESYKDLEGQELENVAVNVAISSWVGDLLMPFEEGLEVEPYKMKEGKKILKTLGERYLYYLKVSTHHRNTRLPEMHIQSFKEYLNTYNIKLVDGELYTTDNPNPKWDWYEIGGRFADSIPVKQGKPVTCARIKDIIWKKDVTEEDLECLKKTYEDNKKIKEDGTSNNPFFSMRYPTLESYIEGFTYFRTYALLNKGKWFESGQMSIFCMDDSTEESTKQYYEDFQNEIESLDPEDYFVIVDLHI